ncbi:MAG: histidine kinase N-terminal 7TM domain-containing protein [Patescibacteria group bacterium]
MLTLLGLITINSFALIINVALGVLLIVKKKEISARYLSGLIFGISLWNFVLVLDLLMKLTHQYSLSLWLAKISIIGPIFVPALFLIFVLYFTNFPVTRKILTLISLPILISLPLVPTQYNIAKDVIVAYQPWALYRTEVGFLYYFFTFYFILYFIIGTKILITYSKKASRVKQIQIWYILSSALLAATAGITTNSIAIILDPSSQYRHLGGPLSIIFPAIVTYVILKHRLFGFIFLVRRALVVASLILTLSGIYFLLNLLLSYWVAETIDPGIAVVTAIVLSVLFYPFLYPRIQQWVPKIVFPSRYTIEERFLHLNQLLYRSNNLQKINTELISWLMTKYRATCVEIYFVNKTANTYHSRDAELPVYHASDEAVRWIEKNAGQIIDLETKDESRAAYYFRERGLCAILPLYHTEERLLGWVAFASPDLHAEDLARLETQLPIITEKFQLILNYEDVIVSAKKDGVLPEHL